jgi:hypothetical protein
MEYVFVMYRVLLSCYVHDRMELHKPVIFPFTHKLKEDLDAAAKWENDWLMQFHPVMHITTKKNPIHHKYVEIAFVSATVATFRKCPVL